MHWRINILRKLDCWGPHRWYVKIVYFVLYVNIMRHIGIVHINDVLFVILIRNTNVFHIRHQILFWPRVSPKIERAKFTSSNQYFVWLLNWYMIFAIKNMSSTWWFRAVFMLTCRIFIWRWLTNILFFCIVVPITTLMTCYINIQGTLPWGKSSPIIPAQ